MPKSRRRISGAQGVVVWPREVSGKGSRWRPDASMRCISVQLAIQATWGDAVMRRYATRSTQPVTMSTDAGVSTSRLCSRMRRAVSATRYSAGTARRREKRNPSAAMPQSTAS
ncbi:hypothetical protein GB937_005696 [Aspergillus fischeri]|nr:hypothetical protein GB937_005696 [Aspergillus fischeri]